MISNEGRKIPIIIDTDPGVDDSFCLAMGAAWPEVFDLKGVTTIGGNNTTAVTTRNALALLQLYHRTDVPVAAGADSYLEEPFGEPGAKFHGANGLAEQIIPEPERKPEPIAACDFIYETAKKCGGELVLVTVGPETNLALAFNKYPDLKTMIKKIVVMGGSLTRGNVTPYAEANIGHDVPAAAVVFTTGIPIDMVGLNVTLRSPVAAERLDEYAPECRAEVKEFMKALIRFRNGEAMHDAVAISTLLDDNTVEWQRGMVRIHTENDEFRGKTEFTPDPNGNMRVAVEPGLAVYEKLFCETANKFTEAQ